jgi:acyl carrier protein
VDRFYQTLNAELFNVYGPTEATIFATSWSTKLSSAELRELPIGQSLPGTFIYILDESLKPQPFGVAGEVFIAGDSLAKGYVNASQKDLDRFVVDSIGHSGSMFRTGDMGWLDVDGNIHFLGRNDRQVKLKGYRIELDEVESALKRLDSIRDAAVKFFDNSKEPQIQAWVTLRGNKPENIRAELAKLLPSYMLPSHISAVNELPYTSSEKVDYSALMPESSSVINQKVRNSQGSFEKRVLACWQSVLKNKELTVFDNFFEVGGDSLAAVIVITELEREYNHSFSLHQLISNPTVAELASFIEQELKLPKVLVSLGDTLQGTSLFIAASGNNDALRFQSLADEMKGFCDLYMLQPPGNEVNLTTKELATLYADEIAEKGTEKVYLAGFSIGGLAALETAKQLQQKNIQVEHLFIVDTVLVALPSTVLFLWHSLSKLENKLGRFAKYVFPPYLRSLLNDKGLFLQVKAMKRYQLEKGSFKVSLLKSNSFGWLQPYLAKKWHRVFGEQLLEFKIETTHSGFFETGKVSELAQILKKQILKSGS